MTTRRRRRLILLPWATLALATPACGRVETAPSFDASTGADSPLVSTESGSPEAAHAPIDTAALVGSWKFDEASGTIAADSSAEDNTGTVIGGAVVVPGKIGNARSFDGTTGYVETTNAVQVDVTAYSIGAWFSTTSSDWQVIFANRGVSVTSGKSLTLAMGDEGAAGSLQWLLDVDGFGVGVESSATYNDGAWHYVVATWSAPAGTAVEPTQFQLFVDGSGPIATSTFEINSPCGCIDSPISGTQGAQIGDSLPWSMETSPVFWNGRLDEVTAWSRALSASDVATLYNGGSGLSVP